MKDTENGPSVPSASDLHRLADRELSLKARIGYVALLLVSLVMACVLGTLWLTEPSLPGRTQTAFAVMVATALAWAVFAARVLTTRRILLAHHRIVAGRMAVAFTGTYLLGSLLFVWVEPSPTAYASTSLATVMVTLAIALHAQAQDHFAKLEKRRRDLASKLGRKA